MAVKRIIFDNEMRPVAELIGRKDNGVVTVTAIRPGEEESVVFSSSRLLDLSSNRAEEVLGSGLTRIITERVILAVSIVMREAVHQGATGGLGKNNRSAMC